MSLKVAKIDDAPLIAIFPRGTVPNLKWSFSLSHTRLLNGGWVREQTITDLPLSQDFAAAELSLAPYAYRELHVSPLSLSNIVLNRV